MLPPSAQNQPSAPARGLAGLPPGAMMPSQGLGQEYPSSSSDERVDGERDVREGESEPLAPPRPRFLTEGARSSWSSQDSSLFDSSSAPQSEEEDATALAPAHAHSQGMQDTTQAQQTPRRRSGQFARGGAAPPPPGAAAPGANNGPTQRTAYNAPRRYSNSHRRMSLENANRRSSTEDATTYGVVARSPSPIARPLSGHERAPPSSFRNNRSQTLPAGTGVGEEHPLSPNTSSNGGHSVLPNSPATDEYHDASGDGYGSSVGHGSAMSYPASFQGQGQQPIYPGGVNAPGAGYPYPIPYPYPRPHNSFMANSAMARNSFVSANGSTGDFVPYAARINGMAPQPPPGLPAGAYVGSAHGSQTDLPPPQPPFAGGPGGPGAVAGYPPPSPTGMTEHALRTSLSQARLREPFLSPASRRSSSVWAPPTPAMYTTNNLPPGSAPGTGVGFVQGEGTGSGFFGGYTYNGVGTGSSTMLALPGKKEPLPSSALRRKISGECWFRSL